MHHSFSPRFLVLWITVSLLPLLTNCALFGGGNETVKRVKGYHISPPSTWTARETGNESDKAYKTSRGSVATITSSCQRNANAPLEVLTKHLLLGARKITYQERERIVVDGSEGLFSSAKATLDGVPFYLMLFVLPHHECVFDFSLVSPKSIAEAEKQEFASFIRSYKYGNN